MKRHFTETKHGYTIKITDYQYTTIPPVAIRIIGTRMGEAVNAFFEPCYLYIVEEADNMESGIARAREIVESLVENNKQMIPANCNPADYWHSVANELIPETHTYLLDTGELDTKVMQLYAYTKMRYEIAKSKESHNE
jgi:hypothetical protein